MSHTNTPTTQGRIKRAALAASLSALLLSLAACGGGGSDSTPSTPSAPATPSTPVADQPIMDVPAPTYAPDSPEMAAYTLLNEERARCGFGRLAQNTKLDYAAKMHGLYLAANQVVTHDEDPTKPAFYAADPGARAMKAGYGSGAAEAVAPERTSDLSIRKLLAGPYHATGILSSSFLDVGLAYTPFFLNYSTLVVDLGVQSGKTPPRVTDVRTYPCEGTVGALNSVGGESPSPFPGESNPIWGQPVIVHGDVSLRVTSASIIGPAGPVAIKVIYGDGQSVDPAGYFKYGSAAIIPAPLAPSTIYTVTVNGTNKGQPFTRTFRFQTGAAG